MVSRGNRGYRCGACKFDYWGSYLQEFELGRAFGYNRCWFYRLSILVWRVIALGLTQVTFVCTAP